MTGKEALQLKRNGSFNPLCELLVTVSAQNWIAREILGRSSPIRTEARTVRASH
jgi:hypothetical protein